MSCKGRADICATVGRGYKTSLAQTLLPRKTLVFPLPCFAARHIELADALQRSMDRRKGGNRDANGGLAEATASRLRFDSDEEAEEVGMEVEESLDAEGEDEQAATEVIGSEKTSADYYFDSYSHFGTRAPAVRFNVVSPHI